MTILMFTSPVLRKYRYFRNLKFLAKRIAIHFSSRRNTCLKVASKCNKMVYNFTRHNLALTEQQLNLHTCVFKDVKKIVNIKINVM